MVNAETEKEGYCASERRGGVMAEKKDSFATEIISEIKRQRNIWRIAAIVSIVLNVIQWIL